MVLFQSRNLCVLTRNLKAQHESWPRDTSLVMFVLDESENALAIRSLYWYASYREICIQARKIPMNSYLNGWRQICGLQRLHPDIFETLLTGEYGVSMGSWVRNNIGIQFKVSSSLVLASSYLAGVIRDSAYIVYLARTPHSSIYTSLCYRGYFLSLCIIYLNLMASATLRSAVSIIREVLSTRQYHYSQYLQRSPDTFKENRKWDYHFV